MFKITLERFGEKKVLPINYQYPLSSAIYKVISGADEEYASFLHKKGYGKGYKFFTFSDLNAKFKIRKDRMILWQPEVSFFIAFHLPEASKHFIKGLFQSKQIEIADKKTGVTFRVKNIEAIQNPFDKKKDNDLLDVTFEPLSPIVCGVKNEKGNYSFLSPEDEQFLESFLYNWRQKIAANYDGNTAEKALLIAEPKFHENQKPKSRLVTIKDDTPAETKIRGFLNFYLDIQAEKRFIDILQSCGAGLYNAQGMGFVQPIKTKEYD